MEYYKNNLQKLGKLKIDDSIQIICNGKKTNFFALNKDSMDALKYWINNITL